MSDSVSVVIPTYEREAVLVSTVRSLLALEPPAAEILVVDQTPRHEAATSDALTEWDAKGVIRWIRRSEPSIPGAMNQGLRDARGGIVLFLDDDIVPSAGLVGAHGDAHRAHHGVLVAGQVLQPGDEPRDLPMEAEPFRFSSSRRQWVAEFPGGNFSVRRDDAISLGGFDERFVRVAYRFESEFADRFLQRGGRILFEPAAGIRHLKAPSGGTRTWGSHLTSAQPSHSVGAYYYVLTSARVRRRATEIVRIFVGAFATRFHLRRPWWIPVVVLANLWALAWAFVLRGKGPLLMRPVGS